MITHNIVLYIYNNRKIIRAFGAYLFNPKYLFDNVINHQNISTKYLFLNQYCYTSSVCIVDSNFYNFNIHTTYLNLLVTLYIFIGKFWSLKHKLCTYEIVENNHKFYFFNIQPYKKIVLA